MLVVEKDKHMVYSEYDEVIGRKANSLKDKLLKSDIKQTKPIDRIPYLLEFIEYCICKIYGIPYPLDHPDNKELEKTPVHKYATCLVVYLYWKVTDHSYSIIVEKIGGNKSDIFRKVQTISGERDEKQLKKIKFLQKKVEEFYKNIF